jgi:hypothetical protein
MGVLIGQGSTSFHLLPLPWQDLVSLGNEISSQLVQGCAPYHHHH